MAQAQQDDAGGAQMLAGAFADPPVDAAHAFRAAMNAMARPGTRHAIGLPVPPAPLSPAAAALLLTLCDTGTPLHLAGPCDTAPLRDWITFHIGAPFAGRQDCDFALGPWEALVPLADYRQGTPEYPDRSATLIVELPCLTGPGVALAGPGIAPDARPRLPLPDPAALRKNAALFPLGLDFFFTCGGQVAALPRTTRVG